jgi:hypothetical protein
VLDDVVKRSAPFWLDLEQLLEYMARRRRRDGAEVRVDSPISKRLQMRGIRREREERRTP